MSKKVNIIIVDDDPKLRKTLSDILRVKGYAPIPAATGQAALDVLEQETATIALIDLRLDDMSGLEVINGIKRRSPSTECIVLTGYASQSSAIEAINLGAYSYVQKPYDIEQLLATIRRATEKRETEEALRESEKRFRTLLEKSVEAIFVLNFNIEFVFWNRAADEMIGLTTTPTKKITLCDVLTSDSLKVAKTNVAHALQTGFTQPRPYELTIRKFDGTLADVEVFIGLVEYQGKPHMLGTARDITERKQAEERERKHLKNIETLSETAMKFVDFPLDKDIYHFIGNQLREFVGESIVVINSIEEDSGIMTTRAVVGMGKFSEGITKLLGRHPEGLTFNASKEEESLSYLFNGRLHDYREGLYGILLRSVPKPVCTAIKKLYNVDKLYAMGFTKDKKLFGTAVIFLPKDKPLENAEIVETFIRQASIAIQRKRAEDALKVSNENFQEVVSNITTVVWKADIANNGTFENTYTSPVVDELLELPAGTIQNDWDKYFRYIKPKYMNRVNDAFREAIISPKKTISCEYEVLKDNRQTAWFHSNGRCFEKNGKLHVFGSTVDITERKRAEQKVKEYLRNIELLSKTAMQFVELPPDIDIYGFVGEKLQEFIGKDSYIVVSSVDEKQDVSTIRAVLGMGGFIDKITKLLGKHPVGMTVNIKGENMYPTPDCKMYSYTEGLYGLLLHAIPKTVCLSIEKLMKIDKIYTVDFTKEDQLLGSVVVFLKKGAEEIKNMKIIETFIKQASIAIQKKQAEEALKFRFVNLAETVSRIYGLRNPYVATHQQGTAKLARAVGEKMGLDEDRLQSLYIGSLLHDIGKTAIPEGILRKPGELTEAEWGVVRTHPQRGYDILKDTNLPVLVAELALHHHERLDGSGYPDGLKGDELILEVRILAVCNVVNAMSLRHPYRPARSKQEITEEITNGKGTRYDPNVVDMLVEMIESGELALAG